MTGPIPTISDSPSITAEDGSLILDASVSFETINTFLDDGFRVRLADLRSAVTNKERVDMLLLGEVNKATLELPPDARRADLLRKVEKMSPEKRELLDRGVLEILRPWMYEAAEIALERAQREEAERLERQRAEQWRAFQSAASGVLEDATAFANSAQRLRTRLQALHDLAPDEDACEALPSVPDVIDTLAQSITCKLTELSNPVSPS